MIAHDRWFLFQDSIKRKTNVSFIVVLGAMSSRKIIYTFQTVR